MSEQAAVSNTTWFSPSEALGRWRSSSARGTIARWAFPYTRPGGVWDSGPRFREFAHLGEYRRGLREWRLMRQGGYTMIGCRRGRNLHRLAADAERRGIPGSMVDCGVCNGGSTALLASGAPSRTVWGFDSFEPNPKPDDDPRLIRSGYSGRYYPPGTVNSVREAVRLIADIDQLRLVMGWVDDTYPRYRDQVGKIAVLHVDLESYESTRLTLDMFYDGVTPGGYVIVDPYGDWPAVRRATDDFRLDNSVQLPLARVDHTGVYWRKG